MPAIKKEVLTTGEVARYCHVAPRTVSKWFDAGKLRGYRIPGSRDRRIPTSHLLAFMRAHGIPLDDLDGGSCRVMIVGANSEGLSAALAGSNRLDVRVAENGFQAGVIAQQCRPHVIIIDVSADGADDAAAICRNIKNNIDLSASRVIAAFDANCGYDGQWFIRCGFDGFIAQPCSADELAGVIQRVTNILN
jgi:excisionase family DNA binding protein